MSAAQLRSITLTNFRSIKGTITVPLDAPIVLIHGANGAGKTSLLSAIELALSGQVASLQRVDPDYAAHLVHKDAKSAELKIETSGLDRNETSLTVTENAITGEALLEADLARFYAERCFLAQSSLGRLLELYQDSAKRSDSALTKFVKDLLGLDHLDAIIDGLHDAGDAADDWIVEHAGANDVVVTSDIPLASRSLKKGATVMGPTGKPFTEQSIGMALAMRELNQHLRETGESKGYNAGFTAKDRAAFLQAFDAAVQRAKRSAG